MGPDKDAPEALEFENVGTFDGKTINIVVKVVSAPGSYLNHIKEGDYQEWLKFPTNRVNGNFGQINLKQDREADFQFCFIDNSTRTPIELEKFSFTFHDFGASLTRGLAPSLLHTVYHSALRLSHPAVRVRRPER